MDIPCPQLEELMLRINWGECNFEVKEEESSQEKVAAGLVFLRPWR